MKTKIKIFLAIIGIAVSVQSVKAQDFNTEFKASFNLSQMDMPGANQDKTFKPGFALGVNLNYKLRSGIYFQSGLGLTKKGSRKHMKKKTETVEDGIVTYTLLDDVVTTIDANYIQIPLAVGYELFLTKNLGISLNGGVYGGFGLKGKTKEKGSYSEYGIGGRVINENIERPTKENDTFGSNRVLEKFDYGLVGNASFIISSIYMVSFGYEYGLMDVSQSSQEMKNRNMTFSLGMRF